MNRQRGPVKKVYTRVEDRSDYIEPENTEELLDILENTGALEGVLSPKFINDRLLLHYERFHREDLSKEELKDIINKAWNLSRPTLHQVIRKFKKTIDVYPNIRGDIMGNCSIVVSRTFRERRFDPGRNTRMTSYFFEFFIYAVLGSLSKYFKEKKKYVSVDPMIMGKICSGDTYAESLDAHNRYDIESPH
jgi:hypothetical protein